MTCHSHRSAVIPASVPAPFPSSLPSLGVVGFPVSTSSAVSLPLTCTAAFETIRTEGEEVLLVTHLLSPARAVKDPGPGEARKVTQGTQPAHSLWAHTWLPSLSRSYSDARGSPLTPAGYLHTRGLWSFLTSKLAHPPATQACRDTTKQRQGCTRKPRPDSKWLPSDKERRVAVGTQATGHTMST